MSKRAVEPIAIDVVLAPNDLSWTERSLLEARVTDEVIGLIQGLSLPAITRVRVVDRTQDGGQCPARMTIEIERQRCRQPMLSSDEWRNSDAAAFANFASNVLYANRHLLLPERVLLAIVTTYPTNVATMFPEIVRLGLSVQVAEAIAGRISPSFDMESRHYQRELLLSDYAMGIVTVEAGDSIHRKISEKGTSGFSDMIRTFRSALFYDLGVICPPVRLVRNPALPTFDFRVNVLALRGPVFTGLRAGEFLVNGAALDVQELLNIEARAASNPLTGVECAIVDGEYAASRCEQEMNLTKWDGAGFVILVIGHVVRAHAELLLTAANGQTMLARLSEAFPLLIVNMFERFPPRFVLNVLRALVREGYSVRDLRGVFEAMLEIGGVMPHVASDEIAVFPPSAKLSHCEVCPTDYQAAKHCADSVRVAMKRYVTSQFAKRGEVTVCEISEPTEARLRRYRGRIRGHEHEGLVAAIAATIKEGDVAPPVVVLTAVDLRRRVREAIEIEFPHVAVVCREEIEHGIIWRNHRHISWPEEQ